MKEVLASEFVSLDGVAESPDRWQLPYFSEEMGEAVGAAMAASDAMLLGRVTYVNDTPKFVVSTTLEEPLGWKNATLIKDNVAEEITRLKQQPGKDIGISGSIALVQSLLRENLLDELRLMIHPVVVGNGKRLFENVGDQKALELVDSKTFSTGVLYLAYQPARS